MFEILGTIGFDWQVALANLVNFLIIFFLLHKLVFKPLAKHVAKRQQEIKAGLSASEENQKILAETHTAVEEEMARARQESAEIIKNARSEAQAQQEKIAEEAREQAQNILEQARKEIAEEKAALIHEVEKHVAELVVHATRKVVGDANAPLSAEAITKQLS